MFSVNGIDGFDGRLLLPRTGAWHANVRIDTAVAPTGQVVLDIGQGDHHLTLNGTVVSGGAFDETGSVRIVGGKGGLRSLATPRHYFQTSAKIVLGDLCTSVGESLSATSSPVALGHALAWWTTARISVGAVIAEVVKRAGALVNWRVLPDGTVWVGAETWPDSGLAPDVDFQVLSDAPDRSEAEIGIDEPVILPGTLLGGRKVSYVEAALGAETRTTVHFDIEGVPQDRLRRALGGAVRAATAAVDYHALYFATVISQATAGTIDVAPEDPRLPSMGNVPLLCGVAKWTIKLAGGGRVLIGWSGGNPDRPFALVFDGDVTATKLVLDVPDLTVGPVAGAEAMLKAQTYRRAEDIYLAAISVAVKAALSGLGLSPASNVLKAADQAWGLAASTYLSTQVKNS